MFLWLSRGKSEDEIKISVSHYFRSKKRSNQNTSSLITLIPALLNRHLWLWNRRVMPNAVKYFIEKMHLLEPLSTAMNYYILFCCVSTGASSVPSTRSKRDTIKIQTGSARSSASGVEHFGISGPHWKKKSCLGPHIKYTNTYKNKKIYIIMF